MLAMMQYLNGRCWTRRSSLIGRLPTTLRDKSRRRQATSHSATSPTSRRNCRVFREQSETDNPVAPPSVNSIASSPASCSSSIAHTVVASSTDTRHSRMLSNQSSETRLADNQTSASFSTAHFIASIRRSASKRASSIACSGVAAGVSGFFQ